MMIRKILSKRLPAFSLAESLFSMLILTIGIMGTTLIISKSLAYSFNTQDTIIAIQLAQEGAELVRNVRDNDFLAGNDGFTEFSDQKNCRASYDDSASANLDCNASQGNASRYRLSLSDGFYKHTGTAGRFSRYIYVDLQQNGGNPRATVRTFVYWGWSSSSFPNFIPGDADPSACTLNNKCVYTESLLTSWKN